MTAIRQIFELGMPWQTLDPFLFCVYHHDDYPNANEQYGPAASLSGRQIGQDFANIQGWNMYHGQQVPGFPAHPHRGFETITVVEQGIVDHADSNGAAGRYGGGDTQWMTAGKGLQHSEMFPLLNNQDKNPLVLFQIWINLAAKNKLAEPGFSMLWREDIPLVEIADQRNNKTTVKVIAGQLNQQQPPAPPSASWAYSADNQVWVWIIKMPAQAEFELPASLSNLNRVLYFYHGDYANIESQRVQPNHGIKLASECKISIQSGEQNCEFLLLQGKPIGEPVTQYGPFVMNSQQEIQTALSDFRDTQFGGWPWPSSEPVHATANSRFADFADGKTIKKDRL